MIACTIHEIAKKQAEKQKEKLVLRPGFEPGSSARKAEILNRTIFGRDFSSSTGALARALSKI